MRTRRVLSVELRELGMGVVDGAEGVFGNVDGVEGGGVVFVGSTWVVERVVVGSFVGEVGWGGELLVVGEAERVGLVV